jgi:phasin family protein
MPTTATRARKTTSTAKPKAAAAPKKTALPGFDLRALLEKAKLPDIDLGGLIDARRRDVDALLEANAQAYRGLESLNRRQAEILVDTMKQLRAGAKEFLAEGSAANKAGKAAELAQRALGQALVNMKEVAEATIKSQEDAMRVLKKRHDEHLGALQKLMTPKA